MPATPGANWPLAFFEPEELRCKGCIGRPCRRDPYGFQIDAARLLDDVRYDMGHALFITSAYRCAFHNAAVGGAARSRHKMGDAFDISLRTVRDKSRLIRAARNSGFSGFGFYGTFLHVDTGRSRQWSTAAGRRTWNGLI